MTIEEMQERLRQAELSIREQGVELKNVVDDYNKLELRFEQHLATSDERFAVIHRRVDKQVPMDLYEERHRELEDRWDRLDRWRANVTGRYIGLAVIGGIFIAVGSSVITHLVGG